MKIGIIFVAAFREGIGEMRQRYEKLQAEFAPVGNELESMQTKIATQQQVLEKNGPTMTPQQVKKLSDDIEDLKRQLKRKDEDARVQASKREEQETSPVFDKINQFMVKYSQQHGLTLILEGGAIGQALLYFTPEANITDDFMREYNKANPVTAAANTPAPTNPAPKPAGTGAARPTTGRKPGPR